MGFRPAVERGSGYSDRQLVELVRSLHKVFLTADRSSLGKAAPFELIVGDVESIDRRCFDGIFEAHKKFRWIKANDIPVVGYNFNLTAHIADAQKDNKDTNGETIIAVSQTAKALDVEASFGRLFEEMLKTINDKNHIRFYTYGSGPYSDDLDGWGDFD